MKKFVLLFISAILVSGCGCLLPQIPPQYIFAGPGCEAPLPSYLNRVNASDNCVLAELVQIPAEGFMITATNPVVTVMIRATDNSGNQVATDFTVTLIDTIPPVLTVDDTTVTADWDLLNTLYNQAERIIADKLSVWDETFPYEKLRLPTQDSSYYKEHIQVWTSPGYAKTGIGNRWFTFINDTLYH